MRILLLLNARMYRLLDTHLFQHPHKQSCQLRLKCTRVHKKFYGPLCTSHSKIWQPCTEHSLATSLHAVMKLLYISAVLALNALCASSLGVQFHKKKFAYKEVQEDDAGEPLYLTPYIMDGRVEKGCYYF